MKSAFYTRSTPDYRLILDAYARGEIDDDRVRCGECRNVTCRERTIKLPPEDPTMDPREAHRRGKVVEPRCSDGRIVDLERLHRCEQWRAQP